MEILIKGQTYKLDITGTVGLTMTANAIVPEEERTVTDEKGKAYPTRKYQYALLYATLLQANPGIIDKVSFMDFLDSLQLSQEPALTEWFWKRYEEVEAPFKEPGAAPESEQKKSV